MNGFRLGILSRQYRTLADRPTFKGYWQPIQWEILLRICNLTAQAGICMRFYASPTHKLIYLSVFEVTIVMLVLYYILCA